MDKIVSSVVARASPPAIKGRHRLYSINMAQDIVHCIVRWTNDSKPSRLAGQAGLGPSLYLKFCMAPQSQSPYPFAFNANLSRLLGNFSLSEPRQRKRTSSCSRLAQCNTSHTAQLLFSLSIPQNACLYDRLTLRYHR
jgi:hypothetical protein